MAECVTKEREMNADLIKALAVTAELTQTQLSEAAARVMAQELSQYPAPDVLRALERCRRELTGRLTLAAVLERLPNGHPGPEEAWSLVVGALGNENETLILTDQMRQAYWAAEALSGNPIAARMAFREVYERLDRSGVPKWGILAGWDSSRRDEAVARAVEQGKLPQTAALPSLKAETVSPAISQAIKRAIN